MAQFYDFGYDYTPLYYNGATQLKYYNYVTHEYEPGIGYHDFIICGKDGNLLIIEDIVAAAVNDGVHWDDAIIELSWEPIVLY